MKRLIFIVIAVLVVGCTPQQQSASVREVVLPTLAPLPTAQINLDAAQRAAVNYLEAWRQQDFISMYELLSFTSQEATSFERFQNLYADAQNEMTMASLSYQARAISRMNVTTVQLVYDVTFQTNILGQFADTGRTMTLVLDSDTGAWRVAWSLADIFAEMGSGATLRFESRIPSRANIYDRNGVILADMNGVVVRVNVIQEEMPERATCIASLAEITGETREDIEAVLSRAGANWVVDVGTLERSDFTAHHERLERECKATFQSIAVRRYLPTGSLLPHVIGNVGLPDEDEVDELVRQGFNAETIIGKSGIERSWDNVLRGSPGGRLSLFGPDGTLLRTLAESSSQIPESLWLTIDADLQEYVLRSIGEAFLENREGWGGRAPGAAGIVLDVNTGELLALASWPTFDANALNPFPAIGRTVADQIQEDIAADERVPLLNRAAQGVFQAGSTFKVVDAVGVLDSGIYTPETTYLSTGSWRYENDVRFDWLAGGHGRVNTAGALTVSCNSCFYQVGFLMNEQDPYLLPGYARRMGLGAVTGLNAISEASGTIPDPDYIAEIGPALGLVPWNYSNAVNLAIGQGEVQVTPLQMARMYAAIANGGTLYRPQLVRERGILDQRTMVAEPDSNGRFDVPDWVLAEVQNGLCAVTTEQRGTAEFVFRLPTPSPLQDIGVCGKTGTAETGIAGEATHAWFIAWAPRERPQVVVAVMVENGGEGSGTAAPIVERIMEYYFFLREQA